MFSLVPDGRVYIRNADTREQLFDLESDPSEVNDLAGLPTTDLAPYRAALGRLVPDLK